MHRTMILVGLIATGCGGPEVSRVRGQILLDGTPFREACVLFWPKTDLSLGMMRAPQCAEEGRFDLIPEHEFGQGRSGHYAVVVGDPNSNPRSPIPQRYWQAETTPLTAEIGRGDVVLDAFDIETKSGGAR